MAKPFFVYNTVDTVWDNSGILVTAGAQVFQYQAGTTTKLTTYPTLTDAVNSTNANANPLLADSSGRISAIWATQALKLVIAPPTDTDPPVNPYRTRDNITSLGQIIQTEKKTANYTVTVSDRDYLIECDASGGSFTLTLLASASAGAGFKIYIKKIDSSANTVTIQGNASENIDGSNTLILYNQNDAANLTNDSTQWFNDGMLNVTKANFIKFMGPETVFAESAGTWTMTRNAEANYSLAHTAASNTAILSIDITDAISLNASKGFKLVSFDVCYSIGTLAMNAHTVTLDKFSMANNAAAVITSVPLTGSLATATQANPYVSNIAVTTPAFNNTACSRYLLEVTANNTSTTVYNFYGINLHFSRNDI